MSDQEPSPKPARRSFRVVLTDCHPRPESVDARFARLLKAALRAYGFRAGWVEVTEEKPREKE